MKNTLDQKIKTLSKSRQNKIRQRADDLIAEEMTLSDLRKALALTQVNLATKLNMNQESISRLERRSDLLLSTLVSYIKAMGGELDLTARFPNRPPVKLNGFEDIEGERM